MIRLFGPEKEALEGSWTPPPLQKLQTSAAKESVSSASPAALSDDEIENLVRRTYPYVAMYNVITKAAMMEENPTRADWNGTFAATSLQDHTARAIARPDNDTLYSSTIMDLRAEPVIVSYPAFDSTFVCLETKEERPPAGAFWSVTLYDAKNGFFIPNDAKKYSVGENAGMRLADDGSIEIHISAEKPEGVPGENWLPIVRGDEALDIVMRLYAPDLTNMKTWTPPKALATPKN